jgi:type IV pilus assembly protein PilB
MARFGRHSTQGPEASGTTLQDRPLDVSVQEGGGRLGELLIESRLVDRGAVLAALEQKRRGAQQRLGRLLLESGAVSERDLTDVLARQSRMDVIDLRDVTPQPEAVALISDTVAHRLKALPVAFEGNTVVLAVADGTEQTVTGVREAIDRPVQLRMAAQSDLMRAIDRAYRALVGVENQVRVFEARDNVRRDVVRTDGEVASDDAPVVQVVQKILTQALRDRASDVHLEPHQDRVRVRYRIDGALHDVLELPGSMAAALVSRVKIMAGMNIVERRRPQDGQISTSIEDRPVDIRVSTVAVVGGESCGCWTRAGRCSTWAGSACPPRWWSATRRCCTRRTAW